MQSMTGYGADECAAKGVDLQVQVRSVNSRFLEVRCHLPREYLSEEMALKKLGAQFFSRGHVDIYVQRKTKQDNGVGRVEVNKAMAKSYLKQVSGLAQSLGLSSEHILSQIPLVPHLVRVDIDQNVTPGELESLMKVVKSALSRCSLQREKEGAGLKRELSRILKALSTLVPKLERARGASEKKTMKRKKELLREITKKMDLDPALYVPEVLSLEKLDITEEIVRLDSHIKECEALLKKGEPIGKRLDFFAQELLREVNTVGSKSQDAQLTRLVVEAKSWVERFREQVQNLE